MTFTIRKAAFGVALCAATSFTAVAAHATSSTFFGEDLNNSSSTPLASTPNADTAETNFLSFLTGTSTENFESLSTGAGTPLNLSFTGSAGTLSATLTGGGGSISTVAPGSTNGVGRYATSGSNFFEVEAGGSNNFLATFGTAIASFGFHGIDVGDFGGQLRLNIGFDNMTSEIVNVPTTVGSGGSTDGSVFYFGYIVGESSPLISSIGFLTTTGSGDFFAFDDFTIGDREQTVTPTVPLPAPALMLIAGLGALGTAARKRKKA